MKDSMLRPSVADGVGEGSLWRTAVGHRLTEPTVSATKKQSNPARIHRLKTILSGVTCSQP